MSLEISGSSNCTTADQGELSISSVRIWVQIGSCTVAVIYFIIFIVGPYKRWQTNAIASFLLSAAPAAAASVFSKITGMLLSYVDTSQLYLVWAVFLNVAQESAVAANAYSVYDPKSKRISFEVAVLVDNLYVAFLIAFFPVSTKFHRPLWVLWGLTVAKMFQRVLGYRVAVRTYGPENVDLVAHLMSHERDDKPPHDALDSRNVKEYNYRILGEDEVKYKYVTEGNSPSKLRMEKEEDKEKVVTLDRIWDCKGRLLNGSLATRVKDICLSFALFKLLRRRYRHYPAEDESQRNKGKRLILQELLAKDDQLLPKDDQLHCSRTFRVIQVELEFLHDLFFTKYPISFFRGISVLNILQLLVIMLSVWTATWSLQGYYDSKDAMWRKKGVDLVLTYIFICLVIVMELWEFSNHVLSNWTKVLLACSYVRHHLCWDKFYLDKLLRIIYRGRLWSPLNNHMGQYSLLESYKYSSSNLFYVLTCGFAANKVERGSKQSRPAKVTRDVRLVIFRALRHDNCSIHNGEKSLERNEVVGHLLEACKDESFERKVMVWHTATSFFELEMKVKQRKEIRTRAGGEGRRLYSHVAVCLSRYCAYLLLFAPDLLPVNNLVSKLMLHDVISDAKAFFDQDIAWYDKFIFKETGKMYEKMKRVVDGKEDAPKGSIIAKGLDLSRKLNSNVEDEESRWKVLAEFWAEFILFLAPSGDAEAHLKKLSNGGEFITHLWVLLYNAGIIERPGPSSAV